LLLTFDFVVHLYSWLYNRNPLQKYEKSLGLGLEIKSLVLVLVLTTKSYLHHWYNTV